MKTKAWTLGLALAASLSAGHAAEVEGSFLSSTSSFMTGFESDAGWLKLSVASAFTGKAGYDIFKVTLDGAPLSDLLPGLSDDFEYEGLVSGGMHTIMVTGKSYGGSFVGAYEVSPVPEPHSLALALGGLGGLGIVAGVARRRLP